MSRPACSALGLLGARVRLRGSRPLGAAPGRAGVVGRRHHAHPGRGAGPQRQRAGQARARAARRHRAPLRLVLTSRRLGLLHPSRRPRCSPASERSVAGTLQGERVLRDELVCRTRDACSCSCISACGPYPARRTPAYWSHAGHPIRESHRARSPADPAQALDPPRPRDQHPRLQAAGERDRDAHGLRGHRGPGDRAGRDRDAARADDGPPGLGQEADAGADPPRRARHGGGHRPAHPVGPGGAHRALPRPRHAQARGLLLQDPGGRGRARLLSCSTRCSPPAARPWPRSARSRRRGPGGSASSRSWPRPKACAACWTPTPTYASSPPRSTGSSTTQGYILPGLGDAGDRLFGTRTL